MATTVFEDILAKGVTQGIIPNVTKKSRDWYRNVALNSTKTIQPGFDKSRRVTNLQIGSMYMFKYDPKTKDTLPFYDTYPLIFPIEPAPDGFYGINLHYLHPKLRARLMDALYKYSSDKNYNEATRLKISYQILKSASHVSMFKPCIKRYLNSHIRSSFVAIFPNEWDIALTLPTQEFQKASASKVWADSYKKYFSPYTKKKIKK